MLRYCVLAISMVAMSAATAQSDTSSWLRAKSPDDAFSAETPCSSEELERSGRSLDRHHLQEIHVSIQSLVACQKDGFNLMAGVVQAPVGYARQASLFDEMLAHANDDRTAEGTPSLAMIDGHRAYLRRQESNGLIGQTGFVYLSRTKIIFGVAGGQPAGSSGRKELGETVDRFFGSIRVTAQ